MHSLEGNNCFCKFISSVHFDITVLKSFLFELGGKKTGGRIMHVLCGNQFMGFVDLQIFLKCCAEASFPFCITL